ncbi:N-acetylneuraminate synthase [bacterium]|nr:N-acetylneuraminate synthase [bacterium]
MNSTLIIAEAGVNHNGDIQLAKQLIDAAKTAGADAVKFQTFKAEKLVTVTAKQADYQTQNTGVSESQFEMLKRLELSDEAHLELNEYAALKSIQFLSSAFDLDGIAFLNRLGMPIFKIPSGEITNFPYLRAIGALTRPVILSTGMANLGEVEKAMDVLVESGTLREKITLLHCTSDYPAPFEDVNLKAMVTLGHAFQVPVGYSDHTQGIEVSIAAVAMGAVVIEKHFTLDQSLPGPDHKASLNPDELSALVRGIRNVEKALASKNFAPDDLIHL